MKKIVLSIAALCMVCRAWADVSVLIFTMNDALNTQVNYTLGTQVNRIVFKDNTVQLKLNDEIVKSYAEADMASISFGNISTGIVNPAFDIEGSNGKVYSIDGKLLGSQEQIKTLPKGVYVVRLGNVSYKIVKTK